MVALPNTQDRVIRQQIAEAIPLADIAKTPINTAWTTSHVLLPDNAAAGLPVPDKIVNNYVSALTVDNGAIHIVFGNRAHPQLKDKILTLRPAVVDDAPVVPVTWICGYAKAPDKMTIKGNDKTNVPGNLLPLSCRG
jgi:type IV pilus assembly protein PilA